MSRASLLMAVGILTLAVTGGRTGEPCGSAKPPLDAAAVAVPVPAACAAAPVGGCLGREPSAPKGLLPGLKCVIHPELCSPKCDGCLTQAGCRCKSLLPFVHPSPETGADWCDDCYCPEKKKCYRDSCFKQMGCDGHCLRALARFFSYCPHHRPCCCIPCCECRRPRIYTFFLCERHGVRGEPCCPVCDCKH